MVIEVLDVSKNTKSSTQEAQGSRLRNSNTKDERRRNRNVDELSDVDYVVTDANSFQGEAQLYIVEDNEAVINRHVFRTHRVTFDFLFDKAVIFCHSRQYHYARAVARSTRVSVSRRRRSVFMR